MAPLTSKKVNGVINSHRSLQWICGELQSCITKKQLCVDVKDKNLMSAIQRLMKQVLNGETDKLQFGHILMKLLQEIVGLVEDEEAIFDLLESGLSKMMLDIYEKCMQWLTDSQDLCHDKFYEELLETIGVLNDYNINVKDRMLQIFSNKLIETAVTSNMKFTTKLEAVKTLNLMLERCSAATRDKIYQSALQLELLNHFGQLISSAGDYELQVGITEALFRLTHKGNRSTVAQHWFDTEAFYKAFMAVKDSMFETDCRLFLNVVNNHPNLGKSTVISYPCQSVLLGQYELKKPVDPNYPDFWVDFNTASQRITFFVVQECTDSQKEEDLLWETVAICNKNVVFYNVKATDNNCVSVDIQLNSSAQGLISYAPEPQGSTISIIFDNTFDVRNTLYGTFGSEKFFANRKVKASEVDIPVEIVWKKIRDPESGTPSGSQVTYAGNTRTEIISPSQVSRRKVSVPCEPMMTSATMPRSDEMWDNSNPSSVTGTDCSRKVTNQSTEAVSVKNDVETRKKKQKVSVPIMEMKASFCSVKSVKQQQVNFEDIIPSSVPEEMLMVVPDSQPAMNLPALSNGSDKHKYMHITKQSKEEMGKDKVTCEKKCDNSGMLDKQATDSKYSDCNETSVRGTLNRALSPNQMSPDTTSHTVPNRCSARKPKAKIKTKLEMLPLNKNKTRKSSAAVTHNDNVLKIYGTNVSRSEILLQGFPSETKKNEAEKVDGKQERNLGKDSSENKEQSSPKIIKQQSKPARNKLKCIIEKSISSVQDSVHQPKDGNILSNSDNKGGNLTCANFYKSQKSQPKFFKSKGKVNELPHDTNSKTTSCVAPHKESHKMVSFENNPENTVEEKLKQPVTKNKRKPQVKCNKKIETIKKTPQNYKQGLIAQTQDYDHSSVLARRRATIERDAEPIKETLSNIFDFESEGENESTNVTLGIRNSMTKDKCKTSLTQPYQGKGTPSSKTHIGSSHGKSVNETECHNECDKEINGVKPRKNLPFKKSAKSTSVSKKPKCQSSLKSQGPTSPLKYPRKRNSKKVCYKEDSGSDFTPEGLTVENIVEDCKLKPVKRVTLDPYSFDGDDLNNTSAKENKEKLKKSIFSQTDNDNSKSEASWLKSANRNMNSKPVRKYSYHRRQKFQPKPMDQDDSDEEACAKSTTTDKSDESVKIHPPQPKKPKKIRKQKRKPKQRMEIDGNDFSDLDDLYYEPSIKKKQESVKHVQEEKYDLPRCTVKLSPIKISSYSQQLADKAATIRTHVEPKTFLKSVPTSSVFHLSNFYPDLSIERARDEELVSCIPSIILDSPLTVEETCKSQEIQPLSPVESMTQQCNVLLDNDDTNGYLQESNCTNIFTLETPRDSCHIRIYEASKDEENFADIEDENMSIEITGIKSGPSKYKRQEGVRDSDNYISEEDVDEEENASQSSFCPRKLFHDVHCKNIQDSTLQSQLELEDDDVQSSISDDDQESQGLLGNDVEEAVNTKVLGTSSLMHELGHKLQNKFVTMKENYAQIGHLSAEVIHEHVLNAWDSGYSSRKNILCNIGAALQNETNLMESDMVQHKECEEKMMSTFHTQLKNMQKISTMQCKRLKKFAQCSNKLVTCMKKNDGEETDKRHTVRGVISKEMGTMSKLMIKDMERKEVRNMELNFQLSLQYMNKLL